MNDKTQVKIRVRNTELENKAVLYGPNGAGKSLIIRLILSGITARRSVDVGLVEVEAAGPVSLVVIDESVVKQLGAASVFSINEFNFADWGGVAVVNPAVAKRLSFEVYYDKYYDPDKGWVPLTYLSYGQKRRLAIEAALAGAGVVLIENFEAGLHVDAVADLVRRIAESDATVILETHSGLVLHAAQRYGLAMYYVKPLARLKRIERLDDVELFGPELSTYRAVAAPSFAIKGGLHSFLFEIARVSKTSGPHFNVVRNSYSGYVIEHHNGRWRATADDAFSTIAVETDDGQRLVVTNDVMALGDAQVDQICAAGYRCFDAKEIRRRVALSVLAWTALESAGVEAVAKAVTAATGEPP